MGGGSPTETETGTGTGTGTGTTGTGSATVAVRSFDVGDALVDAEGLTLYMFDNDTQGEAASTCTGGCLDNWPALTVEGEAMAGDGVTAELTTFERDDGDTQVAANGWPLYYFAGDSAAGDTNGQGVGDVWFVVGADGEAIESAASPSAPGY